MRSYPLRPDIVASLRDPTTEELDRGAALYSHVPRGLPLRLGMQIRDDARHAPATAFPEFDAAGTVTAIVLSTSRGEFVYGIRGLTIPDGQDLGNSRPLYIGTEPLEMLAMGLDCIGLDDETPTGLVGDFLSRQGLAAGGPLAAKPIVLVGENAWTRRARTREWPAMLAAERLAKEIGAAIGRPVLVAFPPAIERAGRVHFAPRLAAYIGMQQAGSGNITPDEARAIGAEFERAAAPYDPELRVPEPPLPPPPPPPTPQEIAERRAANIAAMTQPTSEPTMPAIRCSSPYRVLLRSADSGTVTLLEADCRGATCGYCRDRHVEAAITRIRVRLREHGGRLFAARVRAADWGCTARQLHRRRVNYFRIASGEGCMLITDTEIDDAIEVSAAEAQEIARTALAEASRLSSSRGWRPPQTPRRPGQLRNIGAAPRALAAVVEEIAQSYGLATQPWRSGTGTGVTIDASALSPEMRASLIENVRQRERLAIGTH